MEVTQWMSTCKPSYGWQHQKAAIRITVWSSLANIEFRNQWYTTGDQAYIIISGAMVLIMVPGLGFLYSGLARRKSALSLIWACLCSCAVVTFQWYFWGYSLAFSSGATNGFIGNLNHFALQGVLGQPSPGSALIPELLYSFYQVRFTIVHIAEINSQNWLGPG